MDAFIVLDKNSRNRSRLFTPVWAGLRARPGFRPVPFDQIRSLRAVSGALLKEIPLSSAIQATVLVSAQGARNWQ
jgi:hypothetical protein